MKTNCVHQGDCIEILGQNGGLFVDLIFADPPFNIGYEYDKYEDNVDREQYLTWTREWMSACQKALASHGSFYIAIGDDYAADVRNIGRDIGLHLRNWIIWYYTFGQHTKAMFARSHTHIFYFVCDPQNFVFNDTHVRFPSARHTEYSDKRANPMGRVPDDVWQEFPRVCGTFKEREGWHGCQMPEALLMRIIRASSNPGDLVMDPFCGSGTTVVAAKKLGRRYLGIDVSSEYIAQTRQRLRAVTNRTVNNSKAKWTALGVETLCSLYRETNTARANLTQNRVAMECFTRLLNERLASEYTAEEVIERLQKLDAGSNLPRLRNDRPYKPRQHKNHKERQESGTPLLFDA